MTSPATTRSPRFGLRAGTSQRRHAVPSHRPESGFLLVICFLGGLGLGFSLLGFRLWGFGGAQVSGLGAGAYGSEFGGSGSGVRNSGIDFTSKSRGILAVRDSDSPYFRKEPHVH